VHKFNLLNSSSARSVKDPDSSSYLSDDGFEER
jgi:hypothetical protein